MTINTAIEQLLEIEQNCGDRGESGEAHNYSLFFRIEGFAKSYSLFIDFTLC